MEFHSNYQAAFSLLNIIAPRTKQNQNWKVGSLGINKNIDIQDILYGGYAGELPLPELSDNEDLLISDSKTRPISESSSEIITFNEAIAAASLTNVDIRPRIFDKITNQWILLDTGSQCSVTKPGPNDHLRPDLLLESVDGSKLPCYGTKPLSVRPGRKEYKIETVISNTTDTILGMDFLDKYGFEFRRGEFGDLFLYDPKSQTSTYCQFQKQKQTSALPQVGSLKLAATSLGPAPNSSLEIFGVSALTSSVQLADAIQVSVNRFRMFYSI